MRILPLLCAFWVLFRAVLCDFLLLYHAASSILCVFFLFCDFCAFMRFSEKEHVYAKKTHIFPRKRKYFPTKARAFQKNRTFLPGNSGIIREMAENFGKWQKIEGSAGGKFLHSRRKFRQKVEDDGAPKITWDEAAGNHRLPWIRH